MNTQSWGEAIISWLLGWAFEYDNIEKVFNTLLKFQNIFSPKRNASNWLLQLSAKSSCNLTTHANWLLVPGEDKFLLKWMNVDSFFHVACLFTIEN